MGDLPPLRRGRIRLVEDREDADYVLSGSVLRLETRGRSFSSLVATLEFVVIMSLSLELEINGGARLQLDSRALEESEIYLASADVEAARTNRSEALRRLSSVLASRVRDAVDIMSKSKDPEADALAIEKANAEALPEIGPDAPRQSPLGAFPDAPGPGGPELQEPDTRGGSGGADSGAGEARP